MRYLTATYNGTTGALTLNSTDAGKASDHMITTINFIGLPTGYIIKLLFDCEIEDTWTGTKVIPSFFLSSGSMVLPNPVLRGAKNGKLGMQLHITSEDGTVVKSSDIAVLDVSEGINDTRYDYIPDYLELMNWIKANAITSVERSTDEEGNTSILFISETDSFEISIYYTDIVGRLVLGETDSTAYRGDRGKIAYDHTFNEENPHNVSKEQVGLGEADNTPDSEKPVSGPQQLALDGKADLIGGKVPGSQLPSYVDDVLETYVVGLTAYSSDWLSLTSGGPPLTPESGKIYIVISSGAYEGKEYRWSGSQYAEISSSLVLGETENTAYRGDRGKEAYEHSIEEGNPHSTHYDELVSKPYIVAREDGVPEWLSTITYNSGAICRVGGTLYASVISANVNHDPATAGTDYWMPYTPGILTPTPLDTFSTYIGDGTSTEFIITHSLGSLDVFAQFMSAVANYPATYYYYERVNTNQIKVILSEAPDVNAIRVVVFRPGTSVSSVNGATGAVVFKYGATLGLVGSTLSLKDQDGTILNSVSIAKENVSGLGTVASKDYGTAEGQVVLLITGGKLPSAVMPSISISEYKGTVATKSLLTSLSTAEIGDYAIVNADGTNNGSWILNGTYSTLTDWVQLPAVGNIISINGYTGVVVLNASDVGAIALSNLITAWSETPSATKVPAESLVVSGLATKSSYYHTTITGDGATTDFTITHGLSHPSDVVVIDDDNMIVFPITELTDTTARIRFDTAPVSGKVYKIRVN